MLPEERGCDQSLVGEAAGAEHGRGMEAGAEAERKGTTREALLK